MSIYDPMHGTIRIERAEEEIISQPAFPKVTSRQYLNHEKGTNKKNVVILKK